MPKHLWTSFMDVPQGAPRGVPPEPAALPRQPAHDVGAVFQEL